MKLVICSPCSPSFRRVSEITAPNKKAYAERWDIELQLPIYPDHLISTDKGWSRLDFMQECLKTCDWMLYAGADTLFMNFRIDARAWCINPYELIAAFDWNGLQSDVMFMRNTPAMHDVLEEAKKRRQKDFGKKGLAGSDQGAFIVALSGLDKYQNNLNPVMLKNKVRFAQASKIINRYDDDFCPGDFIYHAVGNSLIEETSIKKGRQLKAMLPFIVI